MADSSRAARRKRQWPTSGERPEQIRRRVRQRATLLYLLSGGTCVSRVAWWITHVAGASRANEGYERRRVDCHQRPREPFRGGRREGPIAPQPPSVESHTTPVSLRRSPAASDGADGATLSAGVVAGPHLLVKTEVEAIGSQRISIEELRRLWQAKEPVVILDVRTKRSLEGTDTQAKGAVRLPPDHVAERAKELGLNKKEAWLIAYCA